MDQVQKHSTQGIINAVVPSSGHACYVHKTQNSLCAGLMYDAKEKAEACASTHGKTGAHAMGNTWMVGSTHSVAATTTTVPASTMAPTTIATTAPTTDPMSNFDFV